jgi:hypothetical protein
MQFHVVLAQGSSREEGSSRDSEIVAESPGKSEGSFLPFYGGSQRASRRRENEPCDRPD